MDKLWSIILVLSLGAILACAYQDESDPKPSKITKRGVYVFYGGHGNQHRSSQRPSRPYGHSSDYGPSVRYSTGNQGYDPAIWNGFQALVYGGWGWGR